MSCLTLRLLSIGLTMVEIRENEVVSLVLYVGVLIFVLANFKRLKHIPGFALLLAALLTFLCTALLTVLEGVFPDPSAGHWWFNFLEHCGYAGCAILLAVWCCFLPPNGDKSP